MRSYNQRELALWIRIENDETVSIILRKIYKIQGFHIIISCLDAENLTHNSTLKEVLFIHHDICNYDKSEV